MNKKMMEAINSKVWRLGELIAFFITKNYFFCRFIRQFYNTRSKSKFGHKLYFSQLFFKSAKYIVSEFLYFELKIVIFTKIFQKSLRAGSGRKQNCFLLVSSLFFSNESRMKPRRIRNTASSSIKS